MSVLASKRRESKLEVLVYANDLRKMFREFMQRDFGVKSMNGFRRSRYAKGKSEEEILSEYLFQMARAKKRVDNTTALVTANLRSANSIVYPTMMCEYEKRREYQDCAIVNCEVLIQELQDIVETFDVDLNTYGRYVKAINREIGLIKRWRQRDNKIKSNLEGSI